MLNKAQLTETKVCTNLDFYSTSGEMKLSLNP